ncbi:hypothetical protein HP532_00375 [Pseudomonas sp. CrR25]|nr:hypothetical protein [Pseudomonas sp. CrR25]
MKLNFRTLATLTALLFFALAFIWMFAPDLVLSSWGVELSYPVELISRRAAALYAGFGVIFFLARNAEPSAARSALIRGVQLTGLILAALGAFEFVTGHAERGILVAVLIEIAMVLAFSCVACTGTSNCKKSDVHVSAKPNTQ